MRNPQSGQLVTIPKDKICVIDTGTQQFVTVVLDGKPVPVAASDLTPWIGDDTQVKAEPMITIKREDVDKASDR
jgi:hypothetical protein